MSLTVGAFDPGGTTGFVLLRSTSEEEEPIDDCSPLRIFHSAVLIAHCEFPNWQHAEEYIQEGLVDTVVYEDFILYPWKAKSQSFQQIPSAEVIGVIKYLCEKQGIPYIAQTASFAKNSRACRGLDTSGLKPHEADALRHALAYLHYVKRL